MFLNPGRSQLKISPRLTAIKKLSIVHRLDLIIAASILVVVTWFALTLSHSFDPALFDTYADNAWFQSDVARSSANMVEVSSNHARTNVHPIVSLITLPLTKAISLVWPGTRIELASRLVAFVGGFWAAGLYFLCRLLRGTRLNALAFTLLGLSTTAFMFFFSVPDTFGLGSFTILITLLLAAYLPKPVSARAYVFSAVATLSITVTNWMAGLALAFIRLPWRKAMRVSITALFIVAFLALVQKWFVPTSRLFFLGSPEDAGFINDPDSGSILNKLTALLLHAFAAPTPLVKPQVAPYWPVLSMQFSMPGSGSRFGPPALAIWVSLLFLGVCGAWKQRHSDFVKVLALIIAGQISLHLVYGDETVLYSLNLMVALLALAMLSLYAPLGRFTTIIVSSMALLAAILAFINNMQVFSVSTAHISSSLNPRDQVLKAMNDRPHEVWPRGIGHVILARPGSKLIDKAYHEPGGSFSPAPNSFGASIWVTDKAGNIIAASETLPLAEIRQSFDFSATATAPALVTNTQYFTAKWSHDENNSSLWLAAASKGLQLWLMLRSVGPAGGPLVKAEAGANELVLNDTWHIKPLAPFMQWKVANEGTGKIALSASGSSSGSDKSGWLYVAAMLDTQKPATITIQNTASEINPPRQAFPQLNIWDPLVPDADFAASATAQQAHLLMGLTDGHTRPGDPMDYTYPWIRNAAHTIVALTRSGHLDSARQLAAEIAEQDFFGGSGAEADAPGLAIWALDELALALADPAFDAWLWPHIQRKAQWIQACIVATKPILADAEERAGPRKPVITRTYHLCEPAREGLIVGLINNQYPVLFVNATAYAGLEHASRFAARLGNKDMAGAYKQSAQALQLAWQREFIKPRKNKASDVARHWSEVIHERSNDRGRGPIARNMVIASNWIDNNRNDQTYTAAQWPAWIIGDSESLKNAYTKGLNQRWNATRNEHGDYRRRPDRTYFEFAQAHQWLLLGFPKKSRETLTWFFKHQSSQGLYSWWDASEEKHSEHRWPTVRGWVRPESVTPNYWTAAEALLLEIDMLVYVDESKPQKPLVIGAGVPASWLSKPLDSGVIYTAYGTVRWKWANDVLNIETRDPNVPVELGPTFHDAKIVRIKSKFESGD